MAQQISGVTADGKRVDILVDDEGRLIIAGGGEGGGGEVSGQVEVTNFPETQAVSGPLTNDELRDSPVPVSGPLTDGQLRATPVPVSGPLTDAQLRDTPVPVSGPLTDDQLRDSPVPVSGPLTDTQLRDSPVPVSGPLTEAQLTAVTGTAAQTDVTEDPEAAGQTILAVLRGILAELQAQRTILETIAANTDTSG